MRSTIKDKQEQLNINFLRRVADEIRAMKIAACPSILNSSRAKAFK